MVIGKAPKILILGSMPGAQSLQEQQYYAHPRNAFWYILGELLSIPVETGYKEKLEILKKHGIALWDVLYSCERQGSLDSSIKNSSIETNNFTGFFTKHNSLQLIIFNGVKAEQEFVKRVAPELTKKYRQIQQVRLPSTSPAMASLRKEEKLEIWKNLLEPFLLENG